MLEGGGASRCTGGADGAGDGADEGSDEPRARLGHQTGRGNIHILFPFRFATTNKTNASNKHTIGAHDHASARNPRSFLCLQCSGFSGEGMLHTQETLRDAWCLLSVATHVPRLLPIFSTLSRAENKTRKHPAGLKRTNRTPVSMFRFALINLAGIGHRPGCLTRQLRILGFFATQDEASHACQEHHQNTGANVFLVRVNEPVPFMTTASGQASAEKTAATLAEVQAELDRLKVLAEAQFAERQRQQTGIADPQEEESKLPLDAKSLPEGEGTAAASGLAASEVTAPREEHTASQEPTEVDTAGKVPEQQFACLTVEECKTGLLFVLNGPYATVPAAEAHASDALCPFYDSGRYSITAVVPVYTWTPLTMHDRTHLRHHFPDAKPLEALLNTKEKEKQ